MIRYFTLFSILLLIGSLGFEDSTWGQGTSSTLSTRDTNSIGIRVIRDVAYKTGSVSGAEQTRCKLDWYLPSTSSDTPAGFPTIVWFHGGGLQNGHKAGDHEVAIAKRYAGDGIAVASVNYRLSPNANYPAYVDDAAAAVAFVYKNVQSHGGDQRRVFVSGHSAGGYLTAMVGLHPERLSRYGVKRTDLAGYVPIAGQMVTHSTVRGERGIPRHQPIIDEAAPSFHVTKDASPFLCFAGDNDLPARSEENRYFVAAMKAAGHDDVTFVEVAGRDHGSIANRMDEPGDEVAAALKRFINRAAH
ncbi:alpha/beta hydrolase [Roseiconus lacunae]|uniref:alpha/beta hydrolase n=1 Tax=Roseiconus lacunae TaxID=2605694 RepID=UPI001E354E53|nr:alpha/beta hydrolase [Roseiconus lacunae]MCD0462667.1 alpha/beta hydrolase [Roseiconus lacunae]WRQ52587.1 alpha/beta hydrolase [Stieleria sp. HD01]